MQRECRGSLSQGRRTLSLERVESLRSERNDVTDSAGNPPDQSGDGEQGSEWWNEPAAAPEHPPTFPPAAPLETPGYPEVPPMADPSATPPFADPTATPPFADPAAPPPFEPTGTPPVPGPYPPPPGAPGVPAPPAPPGVPGGFGGPGAPPPPPGSYGAPAPYGAPTPYGAPAPYGGPGVPPPPGGFSTPGYPQGPQPYIPAAPLPRQNNAAVTSLVLGILSLFGAFCCALVGLPLAIAALIFGKRGLDQAGEPGGTGRGLAIAGLVTGGIGVALTAIGIAIFVLSLASGSSY